MTLRLGDILVERGVLSEAQRERILEHQRIHARPFGLLAEEMFGVSPQAVELAWASQFARIAEWVDPAGFEPSREALNLVDARQAWQFGVLPLRIECEELVIATTEDRLARALRFSGWRIPMTCRFVLCEEEALFDALAVRKPMAGLTADSMRALKISQG
ncbi:MAG: hypothetical protein H6810_12905 [Phycisphaeraceae bacterium]|nr:MAG: hypothetical protein H6810_12905 [Phycisphaeraceae bacterium]